MAALPASRFDFVAAYREDEVLYDMSLACEGKIIPAHQVCSYADPNFWIRIFGSLFWPLALDSFLASNPDPHILWNSLYTPGAAASIDAVESELSCHSHFQDPYFFDH